MNANETATAQLIPARYGRNTDRPIITLDDELTADQYDAADRIVAWFEAHPGMHNRSTIARGAKAEYDTAASALAWLDRNRMIAAGGNGSWRKYGARR